jgi:hypothetical protein
MSHSLTPLVNPLTRRVGQLGVEMTKGGVFLQSLDWPGVSWARLALLIEAMSHETEEYAMLEELRGRALLREQGVILEDEE